VTGSARFGLLSALFFLLLGWSILYFVDEEKGIRESQQAVGEEPDQLTT